MKDSSLLSALFLDKSEQFHHQMWEKAKVSTLFERSTKRLKPEFQFGPQVRN